MKKIILIVFVMSQGCATEFRVLESQDILITNLSEYSERGVFVSTSHYPGNYSSVGIIQIEFRPEFRVNFTNSKKSENEYRYGGGFAQKVNTANLIRLAINEALRLNANGVMDLKITQVERNLITPSSKSFYRPVYIITGLAIKTQK